MPVTTENRPPYREGEWVDKAEALRIFATGDPEAIGYALIDVCRCEPDTDWVFEQALRFLTHPHPSVRSGAIFALMPHPPMGGLPSDPEPAVEALERVAVSDPDPVLRQLALDALDDLYIEFPRWDGDLPKFRCMPDVLEMSNFAGTSRTCKSCGRRRGLRYCGHGTPFDLDQYAICPWCIADGSAHAKLGVFFTPPECIGDRGRWSPVPPHVIDEIAHRTPALLTADEPPRWWTCCNDAAAFVAEIGPENLAEFPPALTFALQQEIGLAGGDWDGHLARLPDEQCIYVFRCGRCGELGGFIDRDVEGLRD